MARVHLLETPCTSSPDYWVGLEERRQEDEREENGVGFAWRRDEEEEGGGGEENGEDYDDCYCEDCVVGGTHFKIDQISQTKKALLPAMFCLRYIFGSVYVLPTFWLCSVGFVPSLFRLRFHLCFRFLPFTVLSMCRRSG